MPATRVVNLYGRIFISGDIRLLTGLHIGGAQGALEIGGVDNVVLRDPLTSRPYIPGSSIKGKMRSLAEKISGAPQNRSIGKGVHIHTAETLAEYDQFWVNPIYGVPGEIDYEISAPTRLIVRDAFLAEHSARALVEQAQTDLPYTEVKWEAAIDRVTSAATPRQMERVPAGAVFGGFEMVYSVYELPGDLERFSKVLTSMKLLEDDYLGGQGSRGSGKIAFENVMIDLRTRSAYGSPISAGDPRSVQGWLDIDADLLNWLDGNFS